MSIIRIYNSFTEVRQNVKTSSPHQIYFPQDLFDQIMPGSINLEGVKVTSMNGVLKENNLEGKIVHISKEKEIRKVKMIRSRDLLVQDLETLRYFHVDKNEIEYTDVPEETGNQVTFTLEKEGLAVLSYLMYGISWNAKYSLNINGANQTFEGWAHILNNTHKDFDINQTEIYGGDVNTVADFTSKKRGNYDMCRSVPMIEAKGEVGGLYMYSINDKYTLASQSTFSLPFTNASVSVKKIEKILYYFRDNSEKDNSKKF